MTVRSVYRVAATLCASALLLMLGACASYDPYSGGYAYDPGETMAAVGTAAFVGSVAYSQRNYRRYDRPRYHHHYHYNRGQSRSYNRSYKRPRNRPPRRAQRRRR